MAKNRERLRAEESVKQDNLECVKNLSHIELKKFNKNEYAELVFQDLHILLPDFETSQLRETAHYVSNALNNEAKHHLMKKSRNVTTAKVTTLLCYHRLCWKTWIKQHFLIQSLQIALIKWRPRQIQTQHNVSLLTP